MPFSTSAAAAAGGQGLQGSHACRLSAANHSGLSSGGGGGGGGDVAHGQWLLSCFGRSRAYSCGDDVKEEDAPGLPALQGEQQQQQPVEQQQEASASGSQPPGPHRHLPHRHPQQLARPSAPALGSGAAAGAAAGAFAAEPDAERLRAKMMMPDLDGPIDVSNLWAHSSPSASSVGGEEIDGVKRRRGGRAAAGHAGGAWCGGAESDVISIPSSWSDLESLESEASLGTWQATRASASGGYRRHGQSGRGVVGAAGRGPARHQGLEGKSQQRSTSASPPRARGAQQQERWNNGAPIGQQQQRGRSQGRPDRPARAGGAGGSSSASPARGRSRQPLDTRGEDRISQLAVPKSFNTARYEEVGFRVVGFGGFPWLLAQKGGGQVPIPGPAAL
jgi:hypothetical protein